MTEAYTPTANYRLVVPVDGTDVRFAARYETEWDIRKVPTRNSAARPADRPVFDKKYVAPSRLGQRSAMKQDMPQVSAEAP